MPNDPKMRKAMGKRILASPRQRRTPSDADRLSAQLRDARNAVWPEFSQTPQGKPTTTGVWPAQVSSGGTTSAVPYPRSSHNRAPMSEQQYRDEQAAMARYNPPAPYQWQPITHHVPNQPRSVLDFWFGDPTTTFDRDALMRVLYGRGMGPR